MTKKTKIFIIAGVALAAVGVGAFFLLKKDKDDSGTSMGGGTTTDTIIDVKDVGDVKEYDSQTKYR